jgi:phenylpropionate dioxygenase-like ring-hydroxylating dioxygenase large terminal subunit
MSKDFSRFLKPGRVHRQIYTDPAIFELEMTNIFGGAWVFIGHEARSRSRATTSRRKWAAARS